MPCHVLFDRELPRDWSVTTVDAIKAPEKSACVAGPFGSNISSKYFVPEGVPVIRGSNLTDDLTRFVPRGFVFVSPERAASYRAQHVRAGDLVFTCWGTIGQVGLIPENGPYPEYIISNKQLKLRPDTALTDPLYLFYYFASPQMVGHVRNRAIGAAVPGINLGILKALEVVLPPIAEQRRIASILSAYDDLIENNTRRIAILEEMARRIYEEWFVRFRFPGHEGVRMVESELGLVPEGWARETLADCASVTMGQSPSSEFYNDKGEGLPFHQGVTNFGRHFPTHKMFCSSEGRLAEEGDILVSVRAPVGRINLSPSRLVIGRGLCAVRSRTGQQTFLLHRLFETFKEEDSMGNGAIFKAVSKQEVLGLPFLVPHAPLVAAFEEMATPFWSLIRNLTDKNINLRTTRDLLLPKLISGELSVENIEIAREAP